MFPIAKCLRLLWQVPRPAGFRLLQSDDARSNADIYTLHHGTRLMRRYGANTAQGTWTERHHSHMLMHEEMGFLNAVLKEDFAKVPAEASHGHERISDLKKHDST